MSTSVLVIKVVNICGICLSIFSKVSMFGLYHIFKKIIIIKFFTFQNGLIAKGRIGKR